MQIPSQAVNNQQGALKQIKEAKFQVKQIENTYNKQVYTAQISNDLKYIASGSGGSDKQLRIFKYNKLSKSIRFKNQIMYCKFSNDSKKLYVGVYQYIHLFQVNNKFEKICRLKIHSDLIFNIQCISRTIILTSSLDQIIIKTDVQNKQQLLKIYTKSYNQKVWDYNSSLNLIASEYQYKSIQIWNANDGTLVMEKQNSHEKGIQQVLSNNNQLISLDIDILIIWNINLKTKQLEQQQLIEDYLRNISLVLDQQYILALSNNSIKVYTNQGKFIRQFDHYCNDCIYCANSRVKQCSTTRFNESHIDVWTYQIICLQIGIRQKQNDEFIDTMNYNFIRYIIASEQVIMSKNVDLKKALKCNFHSTYLDNKKKQFMDSQEIKAMKQYDKSKQSIEKIHKEIKIIQKFQSKNVIKINEIYVSECSVFIIFEKLQLFDPKDYNQQQKIQFIFDLLNIIQVMHSQGYMHRDIKLSNIMINSQNEIKLIDFGLATKCKKQHKQCGTPGHMAPKIFFSMKYNEQCDIYSLGVLIYEMLSQKQLFLGMNKKDIKNKNQLGIFDNQKFSLLQWDLQELLKEMLQKDPNLRISAKKALLCSIFTKELSKGCLTHETQMHHNGQKII